jgi:hypothetical protein
VKILCVSDVVDPLVYSASVGERFGGIECVLAAGDLPLDYLEFIASALNKPLFFVFGNHNLADFHLLAKQRASVELNLRRYFGDAPFAGHIGGKTAREGALIVAGLGGSMRYNRGENQFTNFEMKMEIFKLIPGLLLNRIRWGRFLDILLTHAPPEGIHDGRDLCHRGFRDFLWFMRAFKPKYLVHGHIHLYDIRTPRKTKYGCTAVVNAFGHTVIEL